MNTEPTFLSCEIELQPGEQLQLPQSITDRVGPGHWLVTVQPAEDLTSGSPVRSHLAFLNSFAAEDEGLYDDYPPR
jgi:hypothetical protein